MSSPYYFSDTHNWGDGNSNHYIGPPNEEILIEEVEEVWRDATDRGIYPPCWKYNNSSSGLGDYAVSYFFNVPFGYAGWNAKVDISGSLTMTPRVPNPQSSFTFNFYIKTEFVQKYGVDYTIKAEYKLKWSWNPTSKQVDFEVIGNNTYNGGDINFVKIYDDLYIDDPYNFRSDYNYEAIMDPVSIIADVVPLPIAKKTFFFYIPQGRKL